jgi:hypothetical protein
MGNDLLGQYVGTLVPSAYDRSIVRERKTEIERALRDAGIEVISSLEAGSFSHGTAIKDKADIDQMVWVSYEDKPRLPSSILMKMRLALLMHPSVVSTEVSSPIVRVRFGSPPHFEVAPAFYSDERRGFDVYRHPGEAQRMGGVSPRRAQRFCR